MKLELDLQSPYTPDGSPRQDLPTGEVLAWDGNEWCNGFLDVDGVTHFAPWPNVILCDGHNKEYIALTNVRLFAPLPTIYENGNEVF